MTLAIALAAVAVISQNAGARTSHSHHSKVVARREAVRASHRRALHGKIALAKPRLGGRVRSHDLVVSRDRHQHRLAALKADRKAGRAAEPKLARVADRPERRHAALCETVTVHHRSVVHCRGESAAG
ncbi:MAG TPA: hypothetical protein VII63_09910 [Caulobacteraceae bacterium]